MMGYLLPAKEEISWKVLFSFLLSELLVLSPFIALDIIPFLLLCIFAVLFIALSFRFPTIWICTVILFHLLILQRTEEISIWEIFFGVYFFGGIIYWFAKKLYLGVRIVTSKSDLYVLLFLGIAFLSAFQALINSTSLLKWFRELIVFISYLMYFPVRETLSDKKSLTAVGISFLILSGSIAVDNLLKYQTAATSAVYAWQLLSGRQTANEPLFLTSAIIGIVLFLSLKSKIIKTLLLGIIIFFLTALLFTFSRGYWAGALVGITLIIFLVGGKHRFKILVTFGLVAVIIIGIISLMFSNLSSSVLQTIVSRLATKSLSASTDPSLSARLMETRAVLSQILSNPILGYGLGSMYRYYNPIEGHAVQTWYVHNGYLFLLYKLGVTGLLLFLMVYSTMLKDAYINMKKRINTSEGYLLAGIISLLISMLLISITSPQFITRDSILIIGLSWAFIGSCRTDLDAK